MNVKEKLTEQLKTAMKSGDKVGLTVLRTLKSAIQNKALEKGSIDSEINEMEFVDVVRKQVKQREDSIDSFKKAKREDLIDKEQVQIDYLKKFLPAQMSLEKVTELVKEVVSELGAESRKEMGQVMNVLRDKTNGSVDNKLLSQEVMKLLS